MQPTSLLRKLTRLGPAMLAAAFLPACVVLSFDEPPQTRKRPFDQPLFERIRVEGFEFVKSVPTAVTASSGFASAYRSDGLWGTGSSLGITTHFRNVTSSELADAVAEGIETARIATLVERSSSPASGNADIVIRGRIYSTGSWWNAWSVPTDIVLVFGLVLPITWAEEYGASIRVYAPDGQFIREYQTTKPVVMRSWHHWLDGSRKEADSKRFYMGTWLATIEQMRAFVADVQAGVYEDYGGPSASEDDPGE